MGVALSATLLAGCGASSAQGDGSAPSGTTPAIRASDAPLLPRTTDALPVMDAEGYGRLLGQLKGTPTVVNFWAAWCPPCRVEAPMLVAAAQKYGRKIQFLGVDILDDRSGAERFIHGFAIPYPSVFDTRGDIRDVVGGIGQPVTVFYGADGQVVEKVDGQLSQEVLDRTIAALLKG